MFWRLSSIRSRRTGTPQSWPAMAEAMAATVASPAAISAAPAVEFVSSTGTSGRSAVSQPLHRVRRQRPAVAGGQAAEDRGLPLRDIRRRILPSFEVSDPEGGLGALVEEVENLVIEFADPGAPIAQVHRDSCTHSLLGTAHY